MRKEFSSYFSGHVHIDGLKYAVGIEVDYNHGSSETPKAILVFKEYPEKVGLFKGQPVKVTGESITGNQILIRSLDIYSTGDSYSPKPVRRWKGVCNDLLIGGGLHDPLEVGDSIDLSLFIPQTPLTDRQEMPSMSDEGRMEVARNKEYDIEWVNDGIQQSLSARKFKTQVSETFIDKTAEEKNKTILYLHYESQGGELLYDVVERMLQSTWDPLHLLSFLSRTQLAWYGGELTLIRKADVQPKFLEGYLSQRTSFYSELSQHRTFLDLLLVRNKFSDGTFQVLLDEYKDHANRETIDRAISYLISSYYGQFLHTRIVAVYAALETLVNDLGVVAGKHKTIGDNQFKKLRHDLEGVIRDKNYDQHITEAIIKKLPELQRPRILDKLFDVMDLSWESMPLARFAFRSTYWKKEMGELLNRRNNLVHAGDMEDAHLLDLFRLQLLVELWILRLLDCPNENINEHIANTLKNNVR